MKYPKWFTKEERATGKIGTDVVFSLHSVGGQWRLAISRPGETVSDEVIDDEQVRRFMGLCQGSSVI